MNNNLKNQGSREVKFRNSIRWKMEITIVGLVVALVVMLTLLQVTSQKASLNKALSTHSSFLKEQMIKKADKASTHLSGHIHGMITPFRLSAVRSFIREAVKDIDDLQYIILMKGKTPSVAYGADFSVELREKILSGDISAFTSRQRESMKHEFEVGGHAFMESVVPIKLGDEHWGVLRLGFSLDELNQTLADSQVMIDEEIRNRVMQASLTALFFLIVGTLAVFFLTYKWIRPIQKLVVFSNELASGNFNATAHSSTRTGDEIGVLAASLEEMAISLRHSYAQLKDYSHTLEHKVEMRTSELARARDVAISASKSKSEFLSSMSHEIRTPMNAVIGFSHLMLDSDLTRQQRNYLLKINTSATSLLGIINDILDFSKIEAGKLKMEVVELNLQEIMSNLSSISSDQAEKKGLDLQFDIPKEIPVLLGDPLRLGQVLVNLLSNAIKFTEEGSIIVAARILERDKKEIRLHFSVTDSGIGIAESQQADLFQSFSQADASTTRKYGGTGLGLAISKQLVEMMGGEISLESALGRGSCFSFAVSFAIAKGQTGLLRDEAGVQQQAESPSRLHGVYLLVADDNEINQEVTEGLLARVGVSVRIVKNGEQALSALREETFDAVLMDMQMPVMDGLDATREIRKDEHFGDIIIIAMTANAMQGDKDQCLQAGMNDYIAKPINPDTLYSTLLKWVKPVTRPRSADVLLTEKPVRHDEMFALPELNGLDVDGTLLRMGGDYSLYHRILIRFHESQGDVITRLRTSLNDSNKEMALYIAHTLKGAAGNVGAVQVRDMAAELEQMMIGGRDIDTAFLNQLEAALAVVLSSLDQCLPCKEDMRKQSNISEQPEAEPLIEKMREMLEDSDGDAVELMDDLKNALHGSSLSKDVSRLQTILDGYDYEAALEMLKRLQNKVG